MNVKQGLWPPDLAAAEVAVGTCGRLDTGRREEQEAGVETQRASLPARLTG